MKHLSIFVVLILLISIYTKVLKNKSESNSKAQGNNIPSPKSIANDLAVNNTIKEVLKKGLNKSEVDKNPERYHILNKQEHNDSYRETKTDAVYYPGKPVLDDSLPTGKSNGKGFYQHSKQPYYGNSATYIRKLEDTAQDGQMLTPIVFQDLDEIKGDSQNLDSLKEKLADEKSYVASPNPEFDDNYNRRLYKNNSKPYYDTTQYSQELKIKELEGKIQKIERVLSEKGALESLSSTPDVEYKRVQSKPVTYQGAANALKEDSNNTIVKNNWYDAKKKVEELNKTPEQKVDETRVEESQAPQPEQEQEQEQEQNNTEAAAGRGKGKSSLKKKKDNKQENKKDSNSKTKK